MKFEILSKKKNMIIIQQSVHNQAHLVPELVAEGVLYPLVLLPPVLDTPILPFLEPLVWTHCHYGNRGLARVTLAECWIFCGRKCEKHQRDLWMESMG